MGGGSSSIIPSFRWNFVRRDQNYEIYQNEHGVLAEKHTIPNDLKIDEDQQMDSYYYRYSTNEPLVKVYRAQYDSSSDIFSNHKKITVFTQYIPYRLADTYSLTPEQGLYVLSEALRGFHTLYQQLGPFAVDETLIGFNQEGKVKVWHCCNFAKNHF